MSPIHRPRFSPIKQGRSATAISSVAATHPKSRDHRMQPSTCREQVEVAKAAIARAASRSWTAHGGGFGEIEVAFFHARCMSSVSTSRDFVTAARAAGKGARVTTVDHVLPNITSPLIVQATISFATAVLATPHCPVWAWARTPHHPAEDGSWKTRRRRCSRHRCCPCRPVRPVRPGAAIMISALGFGLMGDSRRDLWNPGWRRSAGCLAPYRLSFSPTHTVRGAPGA